MLLAESREDRKAADAYSFAKTLMVSLTGQKYPPPGPQRVEEVRDRLDQYVSFNRSGELDLLIQRATQREPASRPQMKEIETELRAWLSPPDLKTDITTLGHFKSRVEGLTMPRRNELKRIHLVKELFETRAEYFAEIRHTYNRKLYSASLTVREERCDHAKSILEMADPTNQYGSGAIEQGLCAELLGQNKVLWCATRSQLMDEDVVQHGATLFVTNSTNFKLLKTVWSNMKVAKLGTAVEINNVTELKNEIDSNLEKAIQVLIDI